MVAEGEGLRPAKPGDIVILMRSPGMAANTYQRALADRGIDSVSDRGGSILDTSEAEIFLALLAILDNPHQDVPLATVLASPVFGFSPDELAAPRTLERDTDYYGALRHGAEAGKSSRASSRGWMSSALAWTTCRCRS